VRASEFKFIRPGRPPFDSSSPPLTADRNRGRQLSVGMNANLLLGFHPDYDGRIPEEHAARYKQFGEYQVTPTLAL
jgi:hypothetical protein